MAIYFCLASGSRQCKKAEWERDLVKHKRNYGNFSKDSYDGLLTFLCSCHTGEKKMSQKTKVKIKSLIKEVLFFTGGRKHWTGRCGWVRALQGRQFRQCFRRNSFCPSLPLTPFASSRSQTDCTERERITKLLCNYLLNVQRTFHRSLFPIRTKRKTLNNSTLTLFVRNSLFCVDDYCFKSMLFPYSCSISSLAFKTGWNLTGSYASFW